MMTDKEVGELWRSWRFYNGYLLSSDAALVILNLIRKLVEERYAHRKNEPLAYTLHDFGISEEEWPNG